MRRCTVAAPDEALAAPAAAVGDGEPAAEHRDHDHARDDDERRGGDQTPQRQGRSHLACAFWNAGDCGLRPRLPLDSFAAPTRSEKVESGKSGTPLARMHLDIAIGERLDVGVAVVAPRSATVDPDPPQAATAKLAPSTATAPASARGATGADGHRAASDGHRDGQPDGDRAAPVTPRAVRRMHHHEPTTLYDPPGNTAVTLLCRCYVRWGILNRQTPARDAPAPAHQRGGWRSARSNG